jgi:hypothetical protein
VDFFLLSIYLIACKKEGNSLNITYSKSKTTNLKGIENSVQQFNVSIYPNPFFAATRLRIEGEETNNTILIKSADGRFKKIENVTNDLVLDFSYEPQETYYDEIKVDNIVYQKQFSKLTE